MSEPTPGPWTLTHIAGTNFAVQEFDIRGMFCDSPNVYPIFNKDTSAIDGTHIFVSPENARLIAAAPEMKNQHENNLIDLGLLRQAIEAGDARAHLLFRIDDLTRDTKAVIAKTTGKDQ